MTERVFVNHTELIDYNVYAMSKQEKWTWTSIAGIVIFTVGYIFYRSLILSLLITPLALYYPKILIRQMIVSRKRKLVLQFREALYALSSSLAAGKSVELAFRDVLKDLSIMYPDPETYIIKELKIILRRLEMNETIEVVLGDFSLRSHIEDIENFVEVFRTCKRTGGNLVQVIKNTSEVLHEKMEIKQEIDTLLAAKKFEQKVLNAMPVLLILFLSVSASDYMEPIFTTIMGRVSMTFSLILLVVAYFISQKIMYIEV